MTKERPPTKAAKKNVYSQRPIRTASQTAKKYGQLGVLRRRPVSRQESSLGPPTRTVPERGLRERPARQSERTLSQVAAKAEKGKGSGRRPQERPADKKRHLVSHQGRSSRLSARTLSQAAARRTKRMAQTGGRQELLSGGQQ